MSNLETYVPFEQIPFGSDDFANNPESRCPCLLLLDTSGSMEGNPIQQLNEGLIAFKNDLLQDSLASKRVEIAIVTFGPVLLVSDFQTVDDFTPRHLSAGGDTPIGAAVSMGVDLVQKRKQKYKDHGVGYFKPWIILITDGSPTDDYSYAAQLIKDGEAKNSFSFFAIGVDNADMKMLSQLSVRTPLKLRGHMFREFFLWVSGTLKPISTKNPGEYNKILPPSGWAEI